MAPDVYLNGLSRYLGGCPACEVLRRVNQYNKAVLAAAPRVVFRESHDDAYPDEWLIIRLGAVDTGEVRIDFAGFFIEFKHG